MNRIVWILLLCLICLKGKEGISYSKNSTKPSTGLTASVYKQVNKSYKLNWSHESHKKLKFKKRRLRESAHIFEFHPEYDFTLIYCNSNPVLFISEVDTFPRYSKYNIRRGPPSLLS